MKNNIICLLLLLSAMAFAQEKVVVGKITVEGNNAGGVNIMNLVSEEETTSNEAGEFKIRAKIDDLILLSSPFFETTRKTLSEEEFQSGKIEVSLVPKTTELDEVVITDYKNLNAVSLGILSKPAKVYTPAERKVRTATTGLFDPLLNLMSGRTANLKKGVEVERKDILIERLSDLYDEEFYLTVLKIPQENIRGFLFFAVEDESLTTAVNAKNKISTKFFLIQLAEEYLELLANEK